MLRPGQIDSFDVETKGVQNMYALQPCRALTGEAWLTTCAVAWWGDGKVEVDAVLRPTVDDLRSWLQTKADENQYVVCWNSAFDVGWLIAIGLRDLVYKIKWLDGMLIYRHLINAPKFRKEGQVSLSLKAAVARFKPEHANYEDGIDYEDESPLGLAKLLGYNSLDARFTLELVHEFLEALDEDTVRTILIEARCIPMVAEANLNGINVNVDKAKALGEALEITRRTSFVKLKLQNPEVTEPMLASPKQLGDLLYSKWNLPVPHTTDKGQPSTDKEALHILAMHDPRAQLVHDYREANNNKAKFSDGLVDSVAYNGDGKSRPAFRIFGTYTGRGTYSSKTGKGVNEVPTGCALHQWKRDPAFRELVEPPEDHDLMEFDFAGQEFRWMAVESGDPTMLNLCLPGEDPHSYMGARCAGISYEALMRAVAEGHPDGKPRRQMGKFANLALQYRTSPPTMVTIAATQHKLKLTLGEARAIRATYLTTYRAVPKYWDRQIAKARQTGVITNLAGRKVYLGTPDTWTFEAPNGQVLDYKWGHESTAINFPIQSIGADQKYLALLVMRDVLTKYDGRFYFELHDGLFFVIPKRYSERAVHEIKHILSNLPYKRAWGVDLPIQFPVDAKVGPSWGQLKEVH